MRKFLATLLCDLGLHRWAYKDMVAQDGNLVTLTTYAWCKRDCPHASAPRVIDVKHTLFPTRVTTYGG